MSTPNDISNHYRVRELAERMKALSDTKAMLSFCHFLGGLQEIVRAGDTGDVDRLLDCLERAIEDHETKPATVGSNLNTTA